VVIISNGLGLAAWRLGRLPKARFDLLGSKLRGN
jgi:hypothetical protein